MMVRTTTGVPPGLVCATRVINKCYDVPLQKYFSNFYEATHLLDVVTVDTKKKLNAASTTFVDDLPTTVVTKHSPEAFRPTVEFVNFEFDNAISKKKLSTKCYQSRFDCAMQR